MRHLAIIAALGFGLPALAQESVYARGQVGWIFSGSAGLSATGSPMGAVSAPGALKDTPIAFGAAIGWKVGDGFRVEGAFDYRAVNLDIKGAASDIHGTAPATDGSTFATTPGGQATVWTAMVNGIYDINLGYDQPFYPYVGVGVGWANSTVTAHNTVAGSTPDNGLDGVSHGGFAFNLLAGMAYEFSEGVSAYVEYKYLNSLSVEVDGNLPVSSAVKYSSNYNDHTVYAGVMFEF